MKYLFSILFIILCVSCNNSDLKTIENENFLISYPESLNREKSGENNILFKLTPKNPEENRNYIESINLVTRDYPNMSLKQAAQKLKKEVNRVGVITDFKEIDFGNSNGYRLEFKIIFDEGMRRYIQDYYKKENLVYILTFASQESVYPEIYEEINTVLKSFRLK